MALFIKWSWLSFLAPCLLCILWGFIVRSVMSFSGGSFDKFGTSWILLRGLYFGIVGLMLLVCISISQSQSKVYFMLVLVPVALILADSSLWGDRFGRTWFDRMSSCLGYKISLLTPKNQTDALLPEGFVGAVPPNARLTVTTDLGPLSIVSGNGLQRAITWRGATLSELGADEWISTGPTIPGPLDWRSVGLDTIGRMSLV